MLVIHLSAECFPIAKVGGLADVVGALPKYQNQLGIDAKVIMPFTKNKLIDTHNFEIDFQSNIQMGAYSHHYTLYKNNYLGFDLYLLHVEGVLDREGVYGYDDDNYRSILFQVAALDFINHWTIKPDVVHCHDHHTGFVPFLMKHAYKFKELKNIPSIFTIHNGEYQGWMHWDFLHFFPWFDKKYTPLLEWNGAMNAMATAIKCAWAVTTVSPNYMEELTYSSKGLEILFQNEKHKCTGILNGIDNEIWNPATDPMLPVHYSIKDFDKGKKKLKKEICTEFGLDEKRPLVVFIGRFVGEKGADQLGDFIWNALMENKLDFSFLVLGNGNITLETGFEEMKKYTENKFNTYIGYNEALAHKVYAAADFLFMPSRVEPCGLNQLYALRYGTIPIVRTIGGLADTVIDYEDEDGYGIRFIQFSNEDVQHAFTRANKLYKNKTKMAEIKTKIMGLDFSWEVSAQKYIDLYQSF